MYLSAQGEEEVCFIETYELPAKDVLLSLEHISTELYSLNPNPLEIENDH